MSHELVFVLLASSALIISGVSSNNVTNVSSADNDYVHVRRLFRLALKPFTDDEDQQLSRTFQLELRDPFRTYTVHLDPQPTPVWPSSRVVVMESGGVGGDRQIKSDEPASKFTRRFYAGDISEDPKGSVVGTFRDGIFEGLLHFGDDAVLHVEPNSDVIGFNAIAYWAHEVLRGGDDGDDYSVPTHRFSRPRWLPLPVNVHRRSKRSVDATVAASSAETVVYLCNVSVVVDHLYYKHFAGSSVEQVFRDVESNVFYADAQFRVADMNEDGQSDGYGFRVSKVIVLQESSKIKEFMSDKADVYDAYHPEALFREMFSTLSNFKDHCAGLFFTYRLMSSAESDGITQVKVRFTDDIRGHGFCSKSLEGDLLPFGPNEDYTKYLTNALPVNFFFKGEKSSPALSIASTIHQLGHLFHAANDADVGDGGCRGNFFMDTPINELDSSSRFSRCSLRDMDKAISKKKKFDIYCIFGCVLRGGNCDASGLKGGSTIVPLTTLNGHQPTKKSDDYFHGTGAGVTSTSFKVLVVCFTVAVSFLSLSSLTS